MPITKKQCILCGKEYEHNEELERKKYEETHGIPFDIEDVVSLCFECNAHIEYFQNLGFMDEIDEKTISLVR